MTDAQKAIYHQAVGNAVYRTYEQYVTPKQGQLIFDYLYKQYDGELYFDDMFDICCEFMDELIVPLVESQPKAKGSDPVYHPSVQNFKGELGTEDIDKATHYYDGYARTAGSEPGSKFQVSC